MKGLSLQFKVIVVIVLLMLVVMGTVIPLTVLRQKNDLLEAAKSTLSVNTDILNMVIKNLMLGGEAPLAVGTMQSLQQIGEFKAINLYRADSSRAFQDYRTLEFVNSFQERVIFEQTPRVDVGMQDNPAFQSVIVTGRPVIRELTEQREMEYFFPLRNEQSCQFCHGPVAVSGPIRGIAHFKVSIAGIYRQIAKASVLLVSFLTAAVVLFSLALIWTIRRLVLNPLLYIGRMVSNFGAGQLDAKVQIGSKDELGMLGNRINEMFTSVQERLQLSKYVSRSTDAMIRQQTTGQAGQKNRLAVLFSDVRGFTRFADQADASLVIERLNQVLDVQARIVEQHHGDIDKFMGDAVMALFQEPESALQAAFDMVRQTHRLSRNWDYPMAIGIGINYGEVVAGNIGSQNRQEYAVIGDTVNLASRLCGLAPPNAILISASFYAEVQAKVVAKAIENQVIKGKSEPITYYAVKSWSAGYSEQATRPASK